MALTEYKKKRHFNDTPEPTGGKADLKKLRFVIQKHSASHLHYDFRLEMKGVLKSWAVPKGPSLNPADKRLAMLVEDHPYDYRDFEGIIPEGNYGAGTVIVWDEGTYEPLEEALTKAEQEKILLKAFFSGSLKFRMNGKKIKGEFALVRTQGRGENFWLLIKHRDEYASEEDITKKDKSVKSKKTLEEVAGSSKNVWISNRTSSSDAIKPNKKPTSSVKKKAPELINNETPVEANTEITEYLNQAKKAAFPEPFKPMLATVVTKAFDDASWIYEIKWDGYRAITFLQNGNAEIYSRNLLSYNTIFQPVVYALQQWKANAVLDGEVVAVNEKGLPDFQKLQNVRQAGEPAKLVYYIFDLLWYNGKDLMELPLMQRKTILQSILPANDDTLHFSDHIQEHGKDFFELALKQQLEGIVAKNADSTYTPNFRSKNWLKIKNNYQLEAIVCGFTKPRNSRKLFGALILGKYNESELKYIGHTGTGFNDETLKEVYNKLQPLIIDKMPFSKKPKTNMPATWVKPELICEIKYSEKTKDDILRHPVFMGLRLDKLAENEKNEARVEPPKASETQNLKAKSQNKKELKNDVKESGDQKQTSGSQLLVPANSNPASVTINNHQIKFTNLDKIYWPDEKITKRDVLNYYYAMAPYILPYMNDRPQSLNRHPNGIKAPNFYQKNVEGKVAEWLTTYHYDSESSGDKEFLVCTDEASLIYIATLGCIEMNPWHSRTQSPENPDWCVIDLDPDDDNTFSQVIETAHVVKQVLDSAAIPSYCKTSGSTGMHIYIPFGTEYSYEQSKLLAQLVVSTVHTELPGFTSIERNPQKRKGKIYLDYLQNRSIQTIAAPYSLRPKPGATVSAPVSWDEVKAGLSIQNFTIYNMQQRLKDVGDIFKPVFGKGINLEETLTRFSSVFEQ